MSKGASLTLDTGCALVLANCTITILVVAAGAPSRRPRYILALRRVSSNHPFPSLAHLLLPPRAGVVYISGCSEGKTNGILHKYPPLQPPVFRNYQTSFFSTPSSLPPSLFLALTLAIFRQKTSRFANVSSRGMVDTDRQIDRGKRAKGKSQACRSGHHFRGISREFPSI